MYLEETKINKYTNTHTHNIITTSLERPHLEHPCDYLLLRIGFEIKMTRRTLGLGFDQATLFEMPFLPSFFMEMTRMNAWRCATARPPAWAFVINFTRISCTITLLADTVGTIFVAAEVARVTFSVHVAWFDFHLSVFDWIVGERKVISESNWVLATCNGMWGGWQVKHFFSHRANNHSLHCMTETPTPFFSPSN